MKKLTFLVILVTLSSFCIAQSSILKPSDFFQYISFKDNDAQSIIQTLGEPKQARDWKTILNTSGNTEFLLEKHKELVSLGVEIAYIYEWEKGIKIYFDKNKNAIHWSISNAASVNDNKNDSLFSNLVFFISDDESIEELLGKPDKKEINIKSGGVDMIYEKIGMKFHCRKLIYSNGSVSFGNRLVRLDIYPKIFRKTNILKIMTDNFYTFERLKNLVGKRITDIEYELGNPQLIEKDPSSSSQVFHYPSYGFMYMVNGSTKKAQFLTCFDKMEYYESYSGNLVKGISFTDTLSSINTLLGEPEQKHESNGQITAKYSSGFIAGFRVSDQKLNSFTYLLN